MSIRYRVYVCLILLGSVVVSGSAGFHFIEGWAWFDAFYMTLTSMTTIGYGEIHPLSHAGRIFNSFLIVVAVFSGGFTIATFTQALLPCWPYGASRWAWCCFDSLRERAADRVAAMGTGSWDSK